MAKSRWTRAAWSSDGRSRSAPQKLVLIAAGAVLAVGLHVAPSATAFFQAPDEASPESGTAQVVAQGVIAIPERELRWRVTERTAPPPANASAGASELGFLTVDSGVLLVEDTSSGAQWRLPAGESVLTPAGTEQIRVALGSEEAGYRELSLVDADAEAPADENVSFRGEPFAGPGSSHDVDLLHDTLGAGAQLTIPSGALPGLVVVLDGSAQITTESGDVLALGPGEAISLTGVLVVTAAEAGADIAAVYVGPAVPSLRQAAATPAAGLRVIEAQDAAATPAAAAAATVISEADASREEAADDDDDGLSNAREAELNTDPALADTDEDGLTDGEEALEVGTSPLAPDTDGDGILDGDEVAQGLDPLDGVAAAVEEPAAEETVTEEILAEEAAPPDQAAAVAGDSDGDGLEDAIELELGTDPADVDTDDDGLLDGDEYYVNQTGTRNPDTDADGVLDGDEVANGTDPNDPGSF